MHSAEEYMKSIKQQATATTEIVDKYLKDNGHQSLKEAYESVLKSIDGEKRKKLEEVSFG
jgi:hypothetical protein